MAPLSDGMGRQLGPCCFKLLDPTVLLLDEPTAALHSEATERVEALVEPAAPQVRSAREIEPPLADRCAR
jgi:ABC-type phosphate transport system ATPase subunit